MDLLKIAGRVANSGTPLYQVFDAAGPVGVCVGFKPSDEAVNNLVLLFDEWNLVSDDGSYGTPYLVNSDGNDVAILDLEIDDPNVPEGYSPLGMDLVVWRTEAEMLEALG